VLWQVVTAPAPLEGPTVILDDGTVSVDGVTPADPRALAAGAGQGLDPNVYALARAITSEQGSRYPAARVGVAWVIVNEARARGLSVLALVTRSKHAGDGFFGRQSQGRYVATSQDPDADAVNVATDVLSGMTDDPTGGARNFDSPGAYGVQDGTTAAGADAFAAKRAAEGKELVLLDGVPESVVRFWRPT
jgi:hypothetical protein